MIPPSHSESPPSAQRHRWVMLAGVWLIYCCFGLTVAAMAPLVKVITSELNLSLSAMGSILGAWPLVYIGAAIPAGTLLDRIGLRRSLFMATILIAVSGALRAAAFDSVSLFFAVAVFGLGGPLVSSGAPKLISLWFGENERGMAMGIYLTGPAVGGITALALTNSVLMPLTGNSWRMTLLIYAGVTVLAGLAWLALTHHPASKVTEKANRQDKSLNWSVYPLLLRLKVVRIVLIMSMGVFLFNHGLNNWLPEILRSGGMTAVEAGYWAAIPTAVGIVGSLLIPRLATPVRRIPILFALLICAGLAALMIATATGGILALALFLQGIARSAVMPITMLVLMEAKEIGHQNMGAAGGLFFTAAEIGGVLGPLLLGILADMTGGFAVSLMMLSCLCGLLAVLSLTLRFETGPTGN